MSTELRKALRACLREAIEDLRAATRDVDWDHPDADEFIDEKLRGAEYRIRDAKHMVLAPTLVKFFGGKP